MVDEVSDDLLACLDAHPPGRARFDALPPSHRNEYLKWIDDAKKPQTRERRIAETTRKLTQS